MAISTPLIASPVAKAYIRPNITRQCYPRAGNLFPRFTSSLSLPQSPLSGLACRQNKPGVLGHCIGPAGLTDCIGNYWEFKRDLRKWCDKQSLPVGAAAFIAVEALQSAVWSVVWKSLCHLIILRSRSIPLSELEQTVKPHAGIYYPLILSLGGGYLIVARSYVVFKVFTIGTAYVMNRLRGIEETDVITCMTAAFITPVMYSLVAGMRDPIIIPIGIVIALVCGSFFDEVKAFLCS